MKAKNRREATHTNRALERMREGEGEGTEEWRVESVESGEPRAPDVCAQCGEYSKANTGDESVCGECAQLRLALRRHSRSMRMRPILAFATIGLFDEE